MDRPGDGFGRAMIRSPGLPKFASFLLRTLLPRRARDTVLADLEEEYHSDVLPALGRRGARAWYWREAASLMRWYLIARFRKNLHDDLLKLPLNSRPKRSTSLRKALGLFESVIQDIHFGARSLRRRPLFTCVAVATLGLGIGATTTMFSVVDGVLLRQLRYEDPGRLANVWITNSDWRDHPFLSDYWDKGPLAWADFEKWRDATTQFHSVAVHSEFTMTLTGLDDPEQISVGLASAGIFQALGVHPEIGRGLLPGRRMRDFFSKRLMIILLFRSFIRI